MKLSVLLVIPLLTLSSCSAPEKGEMGQIQKNTLQTGGTPPEIQSRQTSTGETTQDFGSGFSLKGCDLMYNDEVVQYYGMIGCKPSEAMIQEHIKGNIPSPLKVENIEIMLPSTLSHQLYETSFKTFEDYVADIESNLMRQLIRANVQNKISEEDIEKELKNLEGHYAFERKSIGGVDVLIHKRDTFGMIGDVYEAYIFVGSGKILSLSEEFYHTKLDNALKTLRKIR